VVTASPMFTDGGICIQAGGLFALDPANGKIAWRAALGSAIQSVPVVADDGIYIASLSGEIYALR